MTYISKLIERVIAKQIVKHVELNNLHESFQSAYKTYHSTETALVRVKNDIIRSIAEKKVTLLILLDLSAAFDTVDHTILLDRVKNQMGITGDVHRWLCSYLSDRTQYVSIMGCRSEAAKLTCGVPQGSVLGPLLFGIYTSPLGDIISKHGVEYHLYADDTQLYMAFKPSSQKCAQDASEVLEGCIKDIRSWMYQNKLKLNDGKTEYLLIGNKHQTSKIVPPEINIGDSFITPSHSARNLGVMFDDQMNMDAHISALCKSISFQLFKIGEIRDYLSQDTAATLVHSLITSRLDCANAVLFGLPAKQLNRLQRIQYAAARLVARVGKFTHIRLVMMELHWLPVKERITFKIIIMTFKILIGRAPNYLKDLVKVRQVTSHSLRSMELVHLVIPIVQPERAKQAFSVAAPILWNALPKVFRLRRNIVVEKVTSFKHNVKTYLFRNAYRDLM